MANGDQFTIQDPALFQGIYERALGIPERGRDIYSGWLANRWQDSVNQWALATTPALSDVGAGGVLPETGYTGRASDLSFGDWLEKVKGTAAMFGDPAGSSDLLTRVQALAPGRARELVGEGGELNLKGATGALNYALQSDLQNRFGRLGGRGIFRSAINPAAARQYELDEARRQLTGEGMVPAPNETFLSQRIQALRNQYGF